MQQLGYRKTSATVRDESPHVCMLSMPNTLVECGGSGGIFSEYQSTSLDELFIDVKKPNKYISS